MSTYVDILRVYPTKIKCFKSGSCHLVADTLDELHDMAQKIGLRRSWFQDKKRIPHYDLTPGKQAKAIAAGAVWDPNLTEYIQNRRTQ